MQEEASRPRGLTKGSMGMAKRVEAKYKTQI